MKKNKKYSMVFFIICIMLVFFFAITSIEKESEWSIGIYTGDSIFDLSPYHENPVLTADDVGGDSVADPFLVKDDRWYMFFEVLNGNHGDIGFASSDDGLDWEYMGIAVDEEFHISYPYIFKFQDEYYIIPESYEADSVKLYKAIDFPDKWGFVKDLISGKKFVDSSIFHHDGYFWMFTSEVGDDMLYLYYSDDLLGEWTEHEKSPIIRGDANIARPGGRVFTGDSIIRFAQDDYPFYGNRVVGFEITEISTTDYEENKLGIILEGNGFGWSRKGMHHIDAGLIDEGIVAVDGIKSKVTIFGVDTGILYDFFMNLRD